MIELTMGAAFLMSSLYGAGSANAQTLVSGGTDTKTTDQIVETLKNTKHIENYVRHELSDTPVLVEIARCESTFRQFDSDGKVIRGKVNKADVGVMQINERYHSDDAIRLGYDIYSTEGNVAFGKYLFTKYGTSPWSSSSKCWSGASATLARK